MGILDDFNLEDYLNVDFNIQGKQKLNGRKRSKGLRSDKPVIEPSLGLKPSKKTSNWDDLEKPDSYPNTEQNPQDVAAESEMASVDSFTLRLPPSSTIQMATYWINDKYLMVSFKSGGQYGYDNVPLETMGNWMRAASAGSWFYYNIRTTFPYKKV